MSDSGWPLLVAVRARLSGRDGVPEVLDDVPQGTAFPYLTIETPAAVDWSATMMRGEQTTLDVHVWSRYAGTREARDVAVEVKEALHEADLAIDGQHLVLCRHVSTLGPWLDPDGETRHAVVRFDLLTVAMPLPASDGLILWLEADRPDSLTIDGGAVAAWASLVGDGVAAQATPAARPVVQAAAIAGRAALAFDGEGRLDLSGVALPEGAAARQVFVVARCDKAEGFAELLVHGSFTSGRVLMLRGRDGMIEVAFIADAAEYETGIAWGAAPRLVAVAYDGDALSARVDGVAVAPLAVALDTGDTFRAIGGVSVGDRWQGLVAAVLIYDRVLDGAARRRTERYLAQRWGIALTP